MDFFNNLSNEDKTGLILYSIGIIFLLITTFVGLTRMGLWIDELYTIRIIQLPIADLINLGMGDVHPLLYYFIYKLFFKILLIFGTADVAVVGKIVSLIPVYLIAILSWFKIRKNFGLLTAGIFFLCIASMPQLMFYAVEIRMYSWALFFVVASIIYAYEIIKEPNKKKWAILTVLTICSAYTHYYSGLASFSIYLLLLICILKNNRNNFRLWFASSLVSILCFLPWLFVVFQQISNISGNYWIDPITINTIISAVYFILSPVNIFRGVTEFSEPTILGTVMIFIFIYLFYKKRNTFASFSLLSFLLVPIIGILISILFEPFFYQRFMIPAAGCLWLNFSILLAKCYSDKKVFTAILAVVLIIGIIGTISFICIQEEDEINMQMEQDSLNNVISPGDILYNDYFNTYEYTNYLLPNNQQFCFGNDLVNNIQNTLHDSTIQSKINSGSKLYFIDGGNPSTDKFDNSNLTLNEIPINHTIEDNNFKLYEIII